MCGIIGYVGRERPLGVLINGLKSLEYRGYDSAGVAYWNGDDISVIKKKGRIDVLADNLNGARDETVGRAAIGHTRWATHGVPNDINAHPHYDCGSNIFVVHNGVIENYKDLRNKLIKTGHIFRSETDTEIIPHLIEEIGKENPSAPLEEAILNIVGQLKGTFALAVMSKNEPEKLVAVRNFGPLLIGIGENNEYIVASDATPLIKHTRQIIYLNDGDIAIVTPSGYRIVDFKNNVLSRNLERVDWTVEEAEKGKYPHFTLKEIFEQPASFTDSIRGRFRKDEGKAKLGGLDLPDVQEKLRLMEKLIIVGCGTTYLAGKVGEYMLEEYGGIPTEVEFASEFRYRKPIINGKTALLVISQSGETADTLGALKEAKDKGAMALGIVNVVGSTISRETHAGVYNRIGPEIGVASTKAFTSQLGILALYTLFLGRQRQMTLTMGKRIINELEDMPRLMEETLKSAGDIEDVASRYAKYPNFLYLGRKYNLPIASEGALKLKELSYVHAEGYGSGEMKHGPISMIDKNFPTIFIIPKDSVYEKNLSNMQEIKARGGPLIAIATVGDKEVLNIADDVIYIPKTLEMLTPILSVIPLQLFAYYSAVLRGKDVDKPRNLAKSVTVE